MLIWCRGSCILFHGLFYSVVLDIDPWIHKAFMVLGKLFIPGMCTIGHDIDARNGKSVHWKKISMVGLLNRVARHAQKVTLIYVTRVRVVSHESSWDATNWTASWKNRRTFNSVVCHARCELMERLENQPVHGQNVFISTSSQFASTCTGEAGLNRVNRAPR